MGRTYTVDEAPKPEDPEKVAYITILEEQYERLQKALAEVEQELERVYSAA